MSDSVVVHQHSQYTDIRVERKTSGPIGSTHLVTVSADSESSFRVAKWFFFDEYSEQQAIEFAERIVSETKFRRRSLRREAEWTKVADQYSEFAHRIMGMFVDSGFMPIGALEPTESEVATVQLEICEPIYQHIKQKVHDPTSVSQDRELWHRALTECREALDDLSKA
jgi:hypothetical protein